MRKHNNLVCIVFLSLLLPSCTIGGGTEHLIMSDDEFSLDSTSSVTNESSSTILSSDSVSSSVFISSTEQSSSSRTTSLSSSNVATYRVSIYQSYLIEGKGTYGNPRFDFSVDVEAGKPLFSDTRELRELKRMCNEVYEPSGGTYTIDGFFTDETCRIYFTTDRLIEENVNAYYFCHG